MKPDYSAYRGTILFRTTGFEIADIRSNRRAPFWAGRVNGDPTKDGAGNVVYVPLWCKREGREATTVYVHIENIVRPLGDDEAGNFMSE